VFKQSSSSQCQALQGGFFCNLGILDPATLPMTLSMTFETSKFVGDFFSQSILIETESTDQDLLDNLVTVNTTVNRNSDLEAIIRSNSTNIIRGKTTPLTFEVSSFLAAVIDSLVRCGSFSDHQ